MEMAGTNVKLVFNNRLESKATIDNVHRPQFSKEKVELNWIRTSDEEVLQLTGQVTWPLEQISKKKKKKKVKKRTMDEELCVKGKLLKSDEGRE